MGRFQAGAPGPFLNLTLAGKGSTSRSHLGMQVVRIDLAMAESSFAVGQHPDIAAGQWNEFLPVAASEREVDGSKEPLQFGLVV